MKDLSRVLILFLLFLFSPAQAANSLDVVINEIAWMGSKSSYYDEWIELYNNTDSAINLEGWTLRTADKSLEIKLLGKIPANSFYLLERTDDNTLPSILADQIYRGVLKNKGESIELYDNLGNLIDSINCISGWFAGDIKSKKTMERKNSKLPGSDPKNWQTSQNVGGTPKAKNSEVLTLKVKNSFSLKPKKELAAIGQKEPFSKSSFPYLIASMVAIFSAGLIFFLKKQLRTSNF